MNGAVYKLPSQTPIETGSFEGIGRLAFFLLRIADRPYILFRNPLAFVFIPDFHGTIQVSVNALVAALPPKRRECFI